jgi:TonB family protein
VYGSLFLAVLLDSAARGSGRDPVVLSSKSAARLIDTQVSPEYPPLAKVNYIQGSVRVKVRVGRDGRVEEAHVISGHAFLAESSLRAVHQWLYRPLYLERATIATEFVTFVQIKFSLHVRKEEHLPPRPEQDLDRQVRPPELIPKGGESEDSAPDLARPLSTAHAAGPPTMAGTSIRIRVLVSDSGRALDSEPICCEPLLYKAAQRVVERLRFRPAHWGNHPVPWYFDLDVPVSDVSAVTDADGV